MAKAQNNSGTNGSERTCVNCGVSGCKYHTSGNYCSATNIDVQNENAVRKAETFCSTFAPKAGM